MSQGDIITGPRLRHAAIVTVIGYVSGWGVPWASFAALPRLVVANDAAQTTRNIVAHQGEFVAVIFIFLSNFIGDILAAWGLYLLLRPVNASISMFVAWLRVVFAALGLAAVQNLVSAHRLLTRPEELTALGRNQLDAQVHVAITAFNSQFASSLIVFGVYLVLLGWLKYHSGYIPKWLSAVLVINGLAWIIKQLAPYFVPAANLGFLFIPTFGELVLLVWLIGWGTRLKEVLPPSAPAK